MDHSYPWDFEYLNAIVPERPLWIDGPISFEDAYTMSTWVSYGWDFTWIFNKGLEWHTSTWNAKSAAVPNVYRNLVNEYIKRMGYRFSIAEANYFDELKQGDAFSIRSAWSNLGVAPLYHDGYALAYKLTNANGSYVFYSDACLNNWMPSNKLVKVDTPWKAIGDIQVFDAFILPDDIAVGGYELQVAIVDVGNFATNAPAIKLANEGRNTDGWYTVGSVNITKMTDAEFLQARADDILKKGLTESQLIFSANNKTTLMLVIDGKTFVLSTNANNRNIDGEIDLGDGWYLRFDIKGNGSNVKEFKIFQK
jgi:hypothetical protein